VFVDVLPDTYNLDPAKLDTAVEAMKAEGALTPRAVIAVDLFGQPADYPALAAIRFELLLEYARFVVRHESKSNAPDLGHHGLSMRGFSPRNWLVPLVMS
jgi:hypothetical protein